MTAENERESNRRCAQAFLSALEVLDLEAMGACLADDVVLEHPFTGTAGHQVIGPKAAILSLLGQIATHRRGASFDDLVWTPMLDPGCFLAEWQGTWEMIGGPRLTLNYATIFWLQAGKVKRIREYYDTLAFETGMRAAAEEALPDHPSADN